MTTFVMTCIKVSRFPFTPPLFTPVMLYASVRFILWINMLKSNFDVDLVHFHPLFWGKTYKSLIYPCILLQMIQISITLIKLL